MKNAKRNPRSFHVTTVPLNGGALDLISKYKKNLIALMEQTVTLAFWDIVLLEKVSRL